MEWSSPCALNAAYLQEALHFGPLATGLVFGVPGLASVVAGIVAGRIIARRGARVVLLVALLAQSGMTAPLIVIEIERTWLWLLIPALFHTAPWCCGRQSDLLAPFFVRGLTALAGRMDLLEEIPLDVPRMAVPAFKGETGQVETVARTKLPRKPMMGNHAGAWHAPRRHSGAQHPVFKAAGSEERYGLTAPREVYFEGQEILHGLGLSEPRHEGLQPVERVIAGKHDPGMCGQFQAEKHRHDALYGGWIGRIGDANVAHLLGRNPFPMRASVDLYHRIRVPGLRGNIRRGSISHQKIAHCLFGARSYERAMCIVALSHRLTLVRVRQGWDTGWPSAKKAAVSSGAFVGRGQRVAASDAG